MYEVESREVYLTPFDGLPLSCEGKFSTKNERREYKRKGVCEIQGIKNIQISHCSNEED